MTFYERIGRRSKHVPESQTIEFRLLFFTCFTVFLAGAALRRLNPMRRDPLYGAAASGKSIYAEASEAASVCATSAFMGW